MVSIYGDYAVINAKQDEDGKHRTPVKLLEQFSRYLVNRVENDSYRLERDNLLNTDNILNTDI